MNLRRTLGVLLVGLAAASPLLGQAGDGGVLILGGTRGVGLEAARLLKERGLPFAVLVRPSSNRTELEAIGARTLTGDALDRASLDAAFAAGDFHAVVSTLSGKADGGRTADAEGNINAIDAAKAAGVRRFVLVTSIGVGDSRDAMPWIGRFMLGSFLEAKGRAEDHLFASDLDYTVLRPGNLKNTGPTSTAILTDDRTVNNWISRTDVARFVLAALDDDVYIGKVLAAIQPE